MPDTLKVYAYKGYSRDGGAYCFSCDDEIINTQGSHFVNPRKYAGSLAKISKENKRTLDIVWEVPPTEMLRRMGLSAAHPLNEKEQARVMKELAKALSGK